MVSQAKRHIEALIEKDNWLEAERNASTEARRFREQNDDAGAATMLVLLAQAALAQKESSKALKAAREAWPLAQGTPNKELQAEVLLAIIDGLNMQGSAREALRAMPTSIPIAQESGNRALEAGMLLGQAIAQLGLQNAVDAAEVGESALAIYKSIEDTKGSATAMNTIAKALRLVGRLDDALSRAKEAASLWRNLGKAAGVVMAVDTIIDVQRALGIPKAGLVAAEEELSLLREAGVSKRNELIMLEKVIQVATDQGEKLAAMRFIEEIVQVSRKAGDKGVEANRTKQAAQMYFEMNQTQDAVRMAKEAEALFKGLGLSVDVEDMRRLQSSIYIKRGQHNMAPHRDEALLALKSFVKAVEDRHHDNVKQFEVDMNKAATAIKDTEMSTALEALFDKDPTALAFLEKQGWDCTAFKVPTKIYQYAHNATYLTFIAGGMNFGPQFRPVHAYRKDRPCDEDCRPMAVCSLPETEAWQGQLRFRPGIMDAGLQSCTSYGFPPQ